MIRNMHNPISIVVPTLNEAGNILHLLARIDSAMHDYRYEVVVIDDHSIDTTVALIKSVENIYPVKVISKMGKPGKAFSLLEGFAIAQYAKIVMIDADLQYPPEAIPAMVEKLSSDTIQLVTSRRVEQKTPAIRKLASATYNLIFCQMLFGLTNDCQSGLKAFDREVLRHMDLNPTPWSFDLEFIVRTKQAGFGVVDHDITLSARAHGDVKLNIFKTTLELSKAAILLRLTLWREMASAYVMQGKGDES